MRKTALFFLIIFVVIHYSFCQDTSICIPTWRGDIIVDCETGNNWVIENDNGASGTIDTTSGYFNNCIQFNWDLNSGTWVQAKYTFNNNIDLSDKDIFGFTLKGSESNGNIFSLMFSDTNNVFFVMQLENINTISRWMVNLPIPKKMFYFYFNFSSENNYEQIDWSCVSSVFIVIKKYNDGSGGGNGVLYIDDICADKAADWPRQTEFETIEIDESALERAINYLHTQVKSTGLIQSWKEEPEPRAYLYDQSLALIAFSREGEWSNSTYLNEAAEIADNLVEFLINEQKPDGHFARAWNPITGNELVDDEWIGDQAWFTMALAEYYYHSNNHDVVTPLLSLSDYIANSVNDEGYVVPSTEGSVDCWWAMTATGNSEKADKIKNYLLTEVWDEELQYFYRGKNDPFIAMDAATWVSEFTRSPRVNQPEKGLAALSFVNKTLKTTDDSGLLCGFDGMGPVSIWCEGTAQYVAAGGEKAQQYLNNLLTLQKEDGGLPGSPDNWGGTAFGWLSSWTGLAATSWLYFALTKSPFSNLENIVLPDFAPENKNTELDFNIAYDKANNQITLKFNTTISYPILIEIYDIKGNLLFYASVKSNTIHINEINEKGILIIKASSEKERIVKKFMNIN